MRSRPSIILCTLLLFTPALNAQDVPADPSAPSETRIKRWIEELGSGEFQTRQQAAAELSRQGRGVIPSLATAAEKGDLEVSLRVLQVLLQIAKGDDIQAGPVAARALEQLTMSKNRSLASRAQQMLDVYRHYFVNTALRHVLKLGGRIEVDVEDGKPLRVTEPADLPTAAIRLRTIDLRNSENLTDAHLVDLRQAPDVSRMLLSGTSIGDPGLEHLASLPTLRAVYLERTKITDAGLKHVARLPHLETLWLNDTAVGDDGLARLSGLKQLTALDLERTRIGDAGLKHLAALRQLSSLNLRETAIGDEGLKTLATLPNLKTLSVVGTKVTDAGLVHLQGLKKLEFVDLRDTNVTPEAVAKLRVSIDDLVVRIARVRR